MDKTADKFVRVWALCLTAFVVMGLTIPNQFVAGTTISAAEMNANFEAVKAAVDALEARGESRGAIAGWAYIRDDGAVINHWMANGSMPTVSHALGSGVYEITWPGDPVNVFKRGVFVQFQGSTGQAHTSSALGVLTVYTANSTGTLVDLGFNVMTLND